MIIDMNKVVIIVSLVVVMVLLGGVYFLFKPVAPGTTTTTTQPGSQFPDTPYIPYPNQSGSQEPGGQTSPTSTVAVNTSVGDTLLVSGFKGEEGTILDPNNPGHYYLGGSYSNSSPYSLLYNESDQSFNITLYVEPIGETRLQAEQKLLSVLGISEADACYLRYWVGVPYGINQIYAGKNLGFSFCTGATPL